MSSTEQTALTVVGAGVGFLVGGPTGALYGAQIGYTLGMSSLSTTLPDQEGPRLGDLSAQSAGYGWQIPKSWGTVGHYGALLWSSGIRETKHTVSNDTGGKGGPEVSQDQTTFTYSCSFATVFHDGEITAVRRIWANEFLVYDSGGVDDYGTLSDAQLADWITTKIDGNGENSGTLTIYRGTSSQSADPTIQAYEGAANTPAFRDWAYVVFDDLQLARFGNRIPQIKIEYIRVDSAVATSSEILVNSSFSFMKSGSYISDQIPTFDRDGTIHLFMGDWDSNYASSNVDYFKCLPTGTFSYIKSLTLDYNRAPPGMEAEFPMFLERQTGGGYTTLINVWEPQGALHDPGGTFNFNLPLVGLTNPNPTDSQTAFFQRGDINGGTIVYWVSTNLIRVYTYTKSLTLSLLGSASTYCQIDYYDISIASGTKLGVGVSDNYIYVVYLSNDLRQYDYDGNLLNTWSFTPSQPLATNINEGVHVDRDNEDLVYFRSESFLHSMENGSYTYWGAVPNASNDATAEVFSVFNKLMLYGNRFGSSVQWVTLGDVAKASESLDVIVSELCADAGLTAGQYDVTNLAGIDVDGFTKTKVSAPAASITQLMQAYQFSAYEDENKIIFTLRGGAIDKTIAPGDLGAGLDAAAAEILPYKRLGDQSLPLVVHVNYLDYSLDYEQSVQTSRRSNIYSTNQILSVDLPIVLSADNARQIAEKIQSSLWTARNSYEKIALPLEYIDIVPADVVQVTIDGVVHTIRVSSMNVGEYLELGGIEEQSADYTSYITGEMPARTYQGNNLPGPTELYLLDLPALRNRDGDEGYYIAAHGYYSGWKGCVVFIENTAGGWNKVGAVLGASTVGVCTEVFAAGETLIFDNKNTLTVRLRQGSLSSVTKAQLLASKTVNAAAVGKNGSWELIQFMTVTDNGDNTYTLSGLLRGQNGTEWAMTQHTATDLFIVLEENNLLRAYTPDIGSQYNFKAVSIGNVFQSGNEQYFTNNAIATKPFSPVQLEYTDNGDGSYTLTWIRRTRVFGEWRDNAGVPLAENSENYFVQVFNPAAEVVDSTTVTSETATVSLPSEVVSSDPDPDAASIDLFLKFNGNNGDTTIIDESANSPARVCTVSGGASITTSVFKEGGACMDFSSNGYVDSDAPVIPASDDFTAEFFFWPVSLTGTRNLISQYAAASLPTGRFQLSTDGSNILLFVGGYVNETSVATITPSQWSHLALVRDGAEMRVYLEGTEIISASASPTVIYQSTTTRFGRLHYDANPQYFNGRMDWIRITNGVVRYNSNFTPPVPDPTGFKFRVQQVSEFYGNGQMTEVTL